MTEQAKEATEQVKATIAEVVALLTHYSFDLGSHAADRLVIQWLTTYPTIWVRNAAIEALYQGRYKAVSVEQILMLWQRRGKSFPHYNHDFERLVCHKLPRNLSGYAHSAPLLTEPLSPHAPPPAIASLVPATNELPIPTPTAERDKADPPAIAPIETTRVSRHPVLQLPVLPDMPSYLRGALTNARLIAVEPAASDPLLTHAASRTESSQILASRDAENVITHPPVEAAASPRLGTLAAPFNPKAALTGITVLTYQDLVPQFDIEDRRLHPRFYLAKWFWLNVSHRSVHLQTTPDAQIADFSPPRKPGVEVETEATRSDPS